MGEEVLFTIAQDNNYNSVDWTTRLEGLQHRRLDRYYDKAFLDGFLDRIGQKGGTFSFNWYPHNAPGQWMAQNIDRPGTVIIEPITKETTEQELATGRYGYLVVATYLSGYSTFREIVSLARAKFPGIKIVAASVGALLPESSQLADYVVKGSQVHDLRDIIGQSRNDPLKIVTVQSDTETTVSGIIKRANYSLLLSSLGCMYGCDFCPSTAQFGNEYTSPFSAIEIKEAIIAARTKIAPETEVFTVSVAEPQGLGNIRLWREVFQACRDLPFECELVSTTSSGVLSKYSNEELTAGQLRLSTVNIGIESMIHGYDKNKGIDIKALIARLQEAGINVVVTAILGLDWHTRDNIKEEIRLLKELEASGYIVANLKMQPGTPLYHRYKKEGRLLAVPPELLSFYGFQAFTHPEFSPGFNDMLPLLYDAGRELSEGIHPFASNSKIFLNRHNPADTAKRETISRMTKEFKELLEARQYPAGTSPVVEKFAADLYFHLAFRNMDLFHPFILSTH